MDNSWVRAVSNTEPKGGDVVHVTWVDSVAAAGWGVPASSPLQHESYGLLHAITVERLVLTTTFANDGITVLSPLHIPREAVKSIRVIRE